MVGFHRFLYVYHESIARWTLVFTIPIERGPGGLGSVAAADLELALPLPNPQVLGEGASSSGLGLANEDLLAEGGGSVAGPLCSFGCQYKEDYD